MEDVSASWEKFLNPETLKTNFVAAAVFITAYEFLRECMIDHLRGFFIDPGFISAEELLNPGESESYKQKVLCLDKREMVACAKWFKNSGALDESDIALLQEVTDHRNEIAHELPKFISDANHDINLAHLRAIYGLVHKIDNWWIREVEIPTDPELDEEALEGADLDAAFSMRTALLSFLVQVAEGDEARLRELHESWRLSRLFS
jgi:hypothetical protein